MLQFDDNTMLRIKTVFKTLPLLKVF